MTVSPSTKPQKTPVGDLRPSQMLHAFGVGAVVDLPKIAAMVMGLDDWDTAYCSEIGEDRLLAAVQAILGPQVKTLRTPPMPKQSNGTGAFDESARIGVPVAAFPRWMVCPYCRLLAPLGSSMIRLNPNPYRPERTAYVHDNCTKPGKPPDMLPVRFLVACKNGHLDDFPWVWFVHEGPTDCKGALRLYDLGASGEAASIQIVCDGCKKSRRMSDAFGEDGKSNLPQECSGRRPHLRDHSDKDCAEPIRAILLGASNSWFPLSLSSLYIPSTVDKLGLLVEEHWTTLEKVGDVGQIGLLRSLNMLIPFVDYTDAQVWAAIEARKNPPPGGGESTDPRDLKTPEWKVFSDPNPALNSTDFLLTPVAAPEGFEKYFRKVVLVERMREVRALIGFTRIESPGDFSDIEEVPVERRVPLTRKAPTWVPASEVRGEGIFLEFDPVALSAWQRREPIRRRDAVFLDAHQRWREARNLQPPSQNYPTIGYVLLHSFAHALMRQLCLECGYTAASVRERIYWRPEGATTDAMAGLLLYTAAPDSEGTLGGLVSLGDPHTLGIHIAQALEMVRLCASDPLCAEHHPWRDGITLHGASCHACLFAPETSCERSNRYLDRTLLVETVETAEYAFFAGKG